MPARRCELQRDGFHLRAEYLRNLHEIRPQRRHGDDAIATHVAAARKDGHVVTAVTADGMLRARLEGLGAQVVGPSWLLEQLDPVG